LILSLELYSKEIDIIVDYHFDELNWNNTKDEVKDYSGNDYHTKSNKGKATTIIDSVLCRSGDFSLEDTVTDRLDLDKNILNKDELNRAELLVKERKLIKEKSIFYNYNYLLADEIALFLSS